MSYAIFDVGVNDLGFNALDFVSGLVYGLEDLSQTLKSLQAQLDAPGGSSLASSNGFLLKMQAAMSGIQVATQSISQVILIGGEIGKSIVGNIR